MTLDGPTDNALNTELLNAELPDARFVDTDYLTWLYDENPLGPGFCGNGDEDGRRMAHYAVVAQEYRDRDGPAKMVFSLNAVTRSGGQRRGWMTRLGEQIYAEAQAWGALGVIGVSNVNSTPPVVRRLGFRLMGPLPVKVAVPGRPAAEVDHHRVDREYLQSITFGEVAAGLDDQPVERWTNRLTPEYLRWRLSAPNMASPYWVHVTPQLVAVSAVDSIKGFRFPVVLKLAVRGEADRVHSASALVGAICAFHRVPFAIYAGFNRRIRVPGIRPPRRVQPVPLNLIYKGLSDRAPNTSFGLDTFEFLDMDAY